MKSATVHLYANGTQAWLGAKQPKPLKTDTTRWHDVRRVMSNYGWTLIELVQHRVTMYSEKDVLEYTLIFILYPPKEA